LRKILSSTTTRLTGKKMNQMNAEGFSTLLKAFIVICEEAIARLDDELERERKETADRATD
jgi:hypothetical protein